MNYMSFASGIEAATVAWHPLKWKPILFSEIAPFPCKLLNYYYPQVPNIGDMTQALKNGHFINSSVDLIVAGTPCQSFSIAGLRGGLDTANGNLALVFCKILLRKQPKWFIWENVPGVFSSNKGRDINNILTTFRECGYSFAYRILDSQYFGVPQRRRRLFVVGYLGNDWRPPAAVLFEQESLRRDFTPRREKGQEVAGTLDARTNGGGFPGSDGAMNGHVIATIMSTGQPNAEITENICSTLNCNHEQPILYSIMQTAFQSSQSGVRLSDTHATLGANDGPRRHNGILSGSSIRRLTPLECERLQGFPDNYTNIPGASDSARYRAIGNSMTVQVMRWIGERIQLVNKIINE